MGKYGQAAIMATKFMHDKTVSSPIEAWDRAVEHVFPESESSREKGCPKGAYLGLCEEELVRGIEPGNYTRSELNKAYAVDAVGILRKEPDLAADTHTLWVKVVPDPNKTPNEQMDVVVSLWKEGLISGH